MTTVLDDPLTTFGVLFPGANGDLPPLGLTLPEVDLGVTGVGPASVRGAVVKAVRGDVDEALQKVADQSLTDLLMAGWRKEEQLRAAGRRTADQPGRKETVEIGSHRITHQTRPQIEIQLDGNKVAEISVVVTVVAQVDALCVRIAFGRAWEVLAGSVTFSVKLAVGSAPPWSRSKKIDLPGVLHLDDGLVLC
jgi:hypothetical protein